MKEECKLARRLLYAIYRADEMFLLKAKEKHVNYAELSLMYVLDGDEPFSQKEIARQMYFPVTTINTIVKKWEKEGILIQTPVEGERRELHIMLTEAGKEYAKNYLDPIYKAEEEAMSKTMGKYSTEFISALEYYGECMRESLKEK